MKRAIGFLTGAVLAAGVAGGAMAQSGDAANGEKVFRKCKACHEVGPEAKTKTGPVLNGIVGRAAAAEEGFGYSNALQSAGEADALVWTPEALDEFLTKPRSYLPGTKMSFAGLRKEADRQDVIAYLVTFSE